MFTRMKVRSATRGVEAKGGEMARQFTGCAGAIRGPLEFDKFPLSTANVSIYGPMFRSRRRHELATWRIGAVLQSLLLEVVGGRK